MNRVLLGDNLDVLQTMPSDSVPLIYIDPPFNTGKTQRRTSIRTVRDEAGDRRGFGGHTYRTHGEGSMAYQDAHDDYLAWLEPRLREVHRVLTPNGTLYCHLDYREVHYCKVLLDTIFGRESFLNEIIWAYDYGGRTSRKWPPKHDNILLYAKDPERYTFNTHDMERLPYLAPKLAGPEKAARGKLPTDAWFLTIVSPTGKEKTGYPTQKPLRLLERIIRASSNPGDTVLDCFAGSGTTGLAAHALGRSFILIDNNPEALAVMQRRFQGFPVESGSYSSKQED